MYRMIIASLILLLSHGVLADDLKMPIGSQGDQTMTRPINGMTKANVEQRFGAPESMKGPVGEPPISTWKYRSYTVYFEYDRVIHTVLHK